MYHSFLGVFIMTIGQKIKELRQAKNLSQKELGIMSGLSEPAIRNYELGNRTPSPQQLEKIAAALNVSVYAISDPEIEDYNGVLHTLFQFVPYYFAQMLCHWQELLHYNLMNHC